MLIDLGNGGRVNFGFVFAGHDLVFNDPGIGGKQMIEIET